MVQVDPIKPTFNPPGMNRFKLNYDELLSNFGFKFNLCHYIMAGDGDAVAGRGLHLSTIQLNLSRFGHTSPCPPV